MPKNLKEYVTGSSPHTRGAPSVSGETVPVTGIIPAYAGSTSIWRCELSALWDHPRIRGEHFELMMIIPCRSGSSPHTRGAPSLPIVSFSSPGIIPAYAGSTALSCRHSGSHQDHPRIRGEHIDKAWMIVKIMGSSPHTRGAPFLACGPSGRKRIIPAYAGSTSSPPPSRSV